MAARPNNESRRDSAFSEVLAWLQAPRRTKDFPEGPISAGIAVPDLVSRFLTRVEHAGFALKMVNHGTKTAPAWSGHWTHCGNAFAGFKQPEDQADADAARLLSCAALLRNHWCLARLEQGR